jgi:microcystin-dependent protein
MFAGNFAPRGWAFCEGQLLPIASNSALYSLLGTIYGGDGITSFPLPDLRGRVPIGPGHGPGLPNYNVGNKGGDYETTLGIQNMPSHNHTGRVTFPNNASTEDGDTDDPVGNVPAKAGEDVYHNTNDAQLGGGNPTLNIASQGGGQAFNNMQPYVAIHYVIPIQGTFPSRN